MARRFVKTVTSQATPTSGVAKTILTIAAPANFGIAIQPNALTVGFDGTSTTAAKATIDIVKGVTGGTGTSISPARVRGVSGSAQATAKENYSAEPSGGTTIHSEKWHTQGNWTYKGSEIQLDPGEILSVRVTVPAAVPVNANCEHEE